MAIFYMNAQIISRSAGRSSTGAAAYRAGEKIYDERTGQTYDYTRRRGDIEAEILAPEGAPAWVQERERLWNEVEKAERRGDAQVAREIVVAIPLELDREQQRDLVHAYVRNQFVSKGMVADVAIHRNPGNPHAHIMLTMREMGPDGLSAKKNRDWNKPELLVQWREQWAVAANRALERAEREERIDHRSLADQGADRLPQVHLGPHAAALERRGIATEKGDHNRLVAEHNGVVIDLEKARAERQALQVEKVVSERLNDRATSGWRYEHAQAMAKVETWTGGQPVTLAELYQRQAAMNLELNGVQDRIRQVQSQIERATLTKNAMEVHKAALARVRDHQGPLGAVRRLFSPQARVDYQNAQSQVQLTADYLQSNGIRSEADLHQQLQATERQQAQLPDLQGRARTLRERMSTMSTAARGLEIEKVRRRERPTRAQELEQQRLREEHQLRERTKDRSMDRGR